MTTEPFFLSWMRTPSQVATLVSRDTRRNGRVEAVKIIPWSRLACRGKRRPGPFDRMMPTAKTQPIALAQPSNRASSIPRFLGFWRRCTRNLEGRMQRHKFAALPCPHESDSIADGDTFDRYFVFVSGSVNVYARLWVVAGNEAWQVEMANQIIT